MLNTLTYVHRFVPAEDGGLPVTLLLLHGTGGDETSMVPIANEVAPGTAYLSPRGKTVIEEMRRFFPNPGDDLIDRDEIAYKAAEMAAFVYQSGDAYGFDPRRMVAVGYSNGAAMAGSLLLYHPRLLLGAVIFRPVLPPAPYRLPDLKGRPVFIAGGRQDDLAEPEDSERLARLLRQAGADVTLRWEEAGHKLRPVEMQAARTWLVEHFGRQDPG
ncbi:MAG TPA: alpha/beta hydrolase [Anaerolineae bacterium]